MSTQMQHTLRPSPFTQALHACLHEVAERSEVPFDDVLEMYDMRASDAILTFESDVEIQVVVLLVNDVWYALDPCEYPIVYTWSLLPAQNHFTEIGKIPSSVTFAPLEAKYQ